MKIKVAAQLAVIVALTLLSPGLVLAAVQWTQTGSLPAGRSLHTATPLTNGKVLVTGGMDTNYNYLNDCRLYDPSTNTWSTAAHLTHARAWHTATRLADGSVLVVGGSASGNYLYDAERYYPGTNQWAAAGTYTTIRCSHTATLLNNGKVLVVGGYSMTNPQIYYANCDLYNPADNSWTAAGALKTARANHTATLLPTGDVLVVGGDSGTGGNGNPVASTERYNLTAGWSNDANLLEARSTHTATLLRNGQLLVAGGDKIGWTPMLSAELYYSGSWHTTGPMHIGSGRVEHTATLLANGTVLVAGGVDSTNLLVPECELYNPATLSWTTTGWLNWPRTMHTATLLPNGKVLAAGGTNYGSSDFPYCELYNSHRVAISPLSLLMD